MTCTRSIRIVTLLAAVVMASAQQPQECADLQAKVVSLEATLRRLKTEISRLEELLEKLHPASDPAAEPAPAAKSSRPESQRCAAVTRRRKQCSRNATAGSNYCWQHQQQRR
ncbi:MAG: hypothetical protein HY238_03010 [Acidobacteria bacterium]|nr:hypothetical protein [Acidobacteriota bacterium]